MAGKGTRTLNRGQSKPVIVIRDRPIFAWCLAGLASQVQIGDHIVAVTRKGTIADEVMGVSLPLWTGRLGLKASAEVVRVDYLPAGPAQTAAVGIAVAPESSCIVVVNPDQMCIFEMPSFQEHWDAFLAVAYTDSSSASYVEFGEGQGERQISRIWEKVSPGPLGSAGVYGFRRKADAEAGLALAFSGGPHHQGEYFVGPAVSEMIHRGARVIAVPTRAKFDLGTERGIDAFAESLEPMCGLPQLS